MKSQPTIAVVRVLAPRKIDGEYRVGVLVDGVDREALAYYTDDRSDAFATAAAMQQARNVEGGK